MSCVVVQEPYSSGAKMLQLLLRTARVTGTRRMRVPVTYFHRIMAFKAAPDTLKCLYDYSSHFSCSDANSLLRRPVHFPAKRNLDSFMTTFTGERDPLKCFMNHS
ncbi:hypothetical protein SAMN05518683_109101 [Salibacterium halotolerans]|uniref:Uncharacterized protein n=1 Tax=Salibacterium halotolerans TaxID=1884432 RepID=A0A1I5SVA9_9BACI|nr:hypothetical protein SAMN05518683_109101 [Salibacterium halotolerans]